MRFKAIIISAIIFTACGTDKAANNENTETKQETTTKEVSEYRSLYVADAADLGECGKDNEKFLYYVGSDQTFYSCQAGEWITVDVSGKDGATGKDGRSVSTVASDKKLWRDDVTGRSWRLVGTLTGSPMIADGPASKGKCESMGMATPSSDDLKEAVENGLGIYIRDSFDNQFMTAWIADDGGMSVDLFYVVSLTNGIRPANSVGDYDSVSQVLRPDNTKSVSLYCVK